MATLPGKQENRTLSMADFISSTFPQLCRATGGQQKISLGLNFLSIVQCVAADLIFADVIFADWIFVV